MHLSRVAVWRRIMLSLSLVLSLLLGRAQIFPVELSPQIVPPYSVYLPDYASPGSEKLRIVALQKDLTVPSYRLRFEIKIQINGITVMQTSRSVFPPPVTLQPGIPTVLSGSDLYWYVQSQNLDFGNGYSRSTYEQTRSLPEGPVTISFTAYDYNRSDVQVSRESIINFYATRDNPPLLNYPACGMRVNALNPQFLNFNWLPQNTSSPNSALQTNYIFSLWPVLPEGYNYQDIVQNTRPIYSTTTQVPNVLYGPGQPLLTPGLTYAWRVQAVDATGRDLFRNNGYSETCTFIYGGNNSQSGTINYPAITIKAASAGSAQGKIWWNLADNSTSLAAAGYESYRVFYRKPQGSYDWFSADVNDTLYRIFDLEPSTTYEVRLQGYKGGSYGPYSDIANFTTDAKKEIACTDAASMLKPYSGRPLVGALPGMNITYGPWDVQLTQVKALATAGQYQGLCKVTVPFMGNMTFNAKFDNLTIDDSRNVTAGNIIFLTQGLKQWMDSTINNQMGGSDYGNVVSGNDTTNVTVNVSLANLDHLEVTLGPDSTITSFTIPGNPPVVVEVNDSLKVVTIKDVNGNTYSLDNKGNLTPLSIHDSNLQSFFADAQNVAALNVLATGTGVVKFTDAEEARFAFDSWKPFYAQASSILTGQYEKLSGGNGDYYVSQKAIGAGESDIVGLDITLAEGMAKSNLIFANSKGDRLLWDTVGNILNLLGGPAADAQEIYALYPKPGGGYYSLGKLLLSAYEQKQFTAVIVPVVAADGKVPSIDAQLYADSLNSIYNKVNISWKVETAEPFTDASWDADGNKLLTMKGSSFLSNSLTGEPATLVKLFKAQRQTDKTRKYIFVLNGSSDGNKDEAGLLTGDMPRGTRFGFIFLDASSSQESTAITIAHELGHGQFNLEHTFSGDIHLGNRGATAAWPNLEDYVADNYRHLYKYQWNQVHQPGEVIGILESDTAGQNVRLNNYLDTSMLNKDTLYFSFLTPDGKRIYLPKTIKRPIFAHSITTLSCDKLVAGTLVGFTIVNGTTETKYGAAAANNQFAGYYSDAGVEYPYTVPADVSKESLVMMFPESATTLRTVKFTIAAGKLSDYVSLHNSKVPIVDERALGKTLKLFSSDAEFAAGKSIRASNSLLEGLYDDLTEEEADLIDDYDEDAELLPMLKVAAWIKLYPVYYNRYTSGIEHGTFCPGSNQGQQCRIWEKNEKMEELMELRDKDKYEFYCVFLDSLKNYCAGFSNGRQDVIGNLSATSDWQTVMEAFAGLNDVEMQQLSLPKRVLLLKFAIKNDIQDYYNDLRIPAEYGFEKVVVRLFKNTPDNQKNAFLDSLVGSRDFDNKYPHLLAALCKDGKGLDRDEWKEFANLLNGWILTYKPRTGQFTIPDVTDKNVLIFDNNEGLFVLEKLGQYSNLLGIATPAVLGSHYSLTEDFIEDGRIEASTYKDKIFYKADVRGLTKKPYEYIWIYFRDDHVFKNGLKISKGAILPIPAFTVYSLFNDVNAGRTIVGIRTTIDIALLFVGVGELNAAIKAAEAGKLLYSWRFYKSLADLTVASTDIVIRDVFGDKLEKDPLGQKILYWWNIANLTYSFGRLSYEGIQSLRTSSTNIKQAVADYKAAGKAADANEEAALTKIENTAAEMADEAANAQNALLEAFLTRHNLKGSHIEALLVNAGASRGALMIQMGSWEASLFEKLNTSLGRFSTLGSELVTNPALLNHFYDANKKWWYKYAILRENNVSGNTFLPPGFRQTMEDMETFGGVRLGTASANNYASDLGNLFEDDLIVEVGRGFRTGNFDHLPPDIRTKIETMYRNGYRIMITQSKVNLNPWFTTKPQPDMLFFKTDQFTHEIIYTDAIFIDGKLSTSTGFSGAQKDLKSLSGTNKQVTIFDFAREKNPEIFSTGNYDLDTHFFGRTITIQETGKIGTEYKDNIFNATYK